MRKEDCIQIGYIAKAHGLQGEVKAVFDVYDMGEYRHVDELYMAKKEAPLQKVKIQSFRAEGGKQAILHLEGIQNRESAEAMRGTTLYYPEDLLPTLPEGHFYYFQVIGFEVEDEKLGVLGQVSEFYDGAGQDLMAMQYQGQEILIPIAAEILLKADLSAKKVYTRLPEGLLDLYLGTEEESEDDTD